MTRKLLFVLGTVLLLMSVGVWSAAGQGGEDDPGEGGEPIYTTGTDSVGVGTYVAAEAYAVAAGEDPEAEPLQALILPYSIYPTDGVQSVEDFEQPEPAVEGFTFEWRLEAPEGSSAELVSGTVALFMADVEGEYALTLTASDESGNTGEVTWTVVATTYVGVGVVAGEPDIDQCAFCHGDQTDDWLTTAHATVFERAINGDFGAGFNPHFTTGYNDSETADNNGFDDRAREAGWEPPAEMAAGNWEAMVEEFPEVAALANVQCESCHGPGNLHVNRTDMTGDPMIGLGLSDATCAQCHAGAPESVPQEWRLSAHADKNARAFWYPIGEEHQACVSCHSGVGFIDAAAGVAQEERRTDYQPITCAVCHDPHDAENPNQLRIFDSVVLPDGTDVSAAGAAATCMSCHNSRTDPVASVEGEGLELPHYSTAAELMNGVGGYTWDETLPSGVHGFIIEQTCIGCHMAETPGMTEDGEPLPGHETVGGHTFAMVSPVDGTENVAVCQQCHEDAESFALEASGDYDGDGTVETSKDEVDGLLALVEEQVVANGVEVLDHHPYFTLPEDASVELKGAVYNLKFSRDDAASVHNFTYTVALLQLSYEKLAGEPVPNADLMQ